MGRIFWAIYLVCGLLKAVADTALFALGLFTAPGDYSALRAALEPIVNVGGPLAAWIIVGLGLIGLLINVGSGSWRQVFSSLGDRKILKSLSDECAKMSDELSALLGEFRMDQEESIQRMIIRRDEDKAQPVFLRQTLGAKFSQKYLARCDSLVRRLSKRGYWTGGPTEVSSVGAAWYQIQELAKDFRYASDRIEEDTEQGILSIILAPREPNSDGKQS